jgi:hypothetical protein
MTLTDSPGLVPEIVAAQNPDGGWGYTRGSSWTEPTAYALLALAAEGGAAEAAGRALAWLKQRQRPDGGWPPEGRVERSTWVTALVLLLPPDQDVGPGREQAVAWLVRESGQESAWTNRLRRWLSGQHADHDPGGTGWPWYPDTAAWVTPTALSVLAAAKAVRRHRNAALEGRLEMARQYLQDRQCKDGGWNHGYTRGFGYDAGSYPETTGQALLALSGVRTAGVERGLARVEAQLRECRSADGLDWLRLGLQAHGRAVSGREVKPLVCRTIPDMALAVLARAAARGKNLFLE